MKIGGIFFSPIFLSKKKDFLSNFFRQFLNIFLSNFQIMPKIIFDSQEETTPATIQDSVKEGILKKNAPTLTFGYTFLVVDKLISYETSLTIGL